MLVLQQRHSVQLPYKIWTTRLLGQILAVLVGQVVVAATVGQGQCCLRLWSEAAAAGAVGVTWRSCAAGGAFTASLLTQHSWHNTTGSHR